MAALVRWIDFDSKGSEHDLANDKEKVAEAIKRFEVSLAEVVRLVYQCQLQNGATSLPVIHQRRWVGGPVVVESGVHCCLGVFSPVVGVVVGCCFVVDF